MAPAATLAELLLARAASRPDARAVLFLSDQWADQTTEQDSLSWGTLAARAQALAAHLAAQGQAGDRAVLMLPTGADFVVALFACFLARMVAVPVMPPRRLATRDSCETILDDCAPRFILTDRMTANGARAARLRRDGLTWICVEEDLPAAARDLPLPSPRDLALLQYTSGSTSAPKGVMISHQNFMANLAAIREAYGNSEASTHVSWGPLFHDLGLVMDLLQPLYLGALCVLMRPAAFVQRPLNWLKAIHRHGAEVAGAPNFAFDLCVERFRPEQMEGVDLSGWKLAFSGAEPVRAATLARFAKAFAPYGFDARAFYPSYGLAEATLVVSAGRRGNGATVHAVSSQALLDNRVAAPRDDADSRLLVACGTAVAHSAIAIVDPENGAPRAPDTIGEILVQGPGIAGGYWRKDAASAETFQARIAGRDGAWLRTGDLGYCDSQGALVITGRSKDVLIIRGMNHYPQDVEETVQRAHPALAGQVGAVFVEGEGAERIIVAQEVARSHRQDLNMAEIVGAVREAVAQEHELSVHAVVLLGPGALPKTTSGKVQRSLTARLWREGGLETLQP